MSKLVVLAETNCLGYLQKHNIKPAEFYTDFELFKNKASVLQDVKVLVLFKGTCRFSKRLVLDCAETIRKRVEAQTSKMQGIYILSDVILPTCKDYYLYAGSPLWGAKCASWKVKGNRQALSEIIGEYEPSDNPMIYLTSLDFGIDEDALQKVRAVNNYDAQLKEKIKVPELV